MDQRQTSERAAAAASFVGIDVSKAALAVASRPARDAWRCAHDEAGIVEVVGRLRTLGPHLIVLEATGGLQRLVVAALALAGLPVAVVTPRQVRDCATATGQDRRLGRCRAGPLRRGAPPPATPVAG
jgi:transposase